MIFYVKADIADGRLIIESRNLRKWPQKAYIGIGTNEGGRAVCKAGDLDQEAVQDVLKLERVIKAAGLNGQRLKVVIAECAVHNEAAWAKRLPDALKFLYGPAARNSGMHTTVQHSTDQLDER